jgi:hypothetical protein
VIICSVKANKQYLFHFFQKNAGHHTRFNALEAASNRRIGEGVEPCNILPLLEAPLPMRPSIRLLPALSRTDRGSHRLKRTRAFNTGTALSCTFLLQR